jgi:hypothetical protein
VTTRERSVMRVWMYERGKWAEIPDPFGGAEEFSSELDGLGFSSDTPVLLLGDPDAFHVEAYEAERGIVVLDYSEDRAAESEFLVVVNTWASWYPVFVSDLPSLVQLIGELRPILASEREALDFERSGAAREHA